MAVSYTHLDVYKRQEEVRADIYAEIDRLYAADATGADYGAFESQLYDKLTANVKERNLEITESVDQALDVYKRQP